MAALRETVQTTLGTELLEAALGTAEQQETELGTAVTVVVEV